MFAIEDFLISINGMIGLETFTLLKVENSRFFYWKKSLNWLGRRLAALFSKYIVVSEVAFPINPVVSDSLHDF